MKIRIILSFFALAGSLIACDNRDKYFEELNTSPELSFSNGETHIVDSVKISHNTSGDYGFSLNYRDLNSNIAEINYSSDNNGVLIQNGEMVYGDVSAEDQLNFAYRPVDKGTHNIQFDITDNFGKSQTVSLELFAFENLAPKAKFKFENKPLYSEYEYHFNAEESFDQDQRFGGSIAGYQFLVNNREIFTTNTTAKYIFPEPGTYEVKLQVFDNNGAIAETTKTIEVK